MSRRAAIVMTAVGFLLLGTSACGVPIDSDPRVLSQTTIASNDQAPTTVPGPGAEEVSVYFLSEDVLVRSVYPVGEAEPTLSTGINFALAGPTEEATGVLGTAIPPGTILLSAEVVGGLATIDLSGEINDVEGLTQKQAFAQLVFTALGFEPTERVRFRVDGEPIDAPTDEGSLAIITADDYDKPLNPR